MAVDLWVGLLQQWKHPLVTNLDGCCLVLNVCVDLNGDQIKWDLDSNSTELQTQQQCCQNVEMKL